MKMLLRDIQKAMSAALRAEDIQKGAPVLDHFYKFLERHSLPPERSLQLYQNNIRAALKASLESSFPLSAMLVGKECFLFLCEAYSRACPYARSQALYLYGEDFPAFASSQKGMGQVPYLYDFMKLEFAYLRAQESAEALRPAPNKNRRYLYWKLKKIFQQKEKDSSLEPYVLANPNLAFSTSKYPLLAIWKRCLQSYDAQNKPLSSEKSAAASDSNGIIIEKNAPTESLVIYKEEELGDRDTMIHKVYVEKLSKAAAKILQASVQAVPISELCLNKKEYRKSLGLIREMAARNWLLLKS